MMRRHDIGEAAIGTLWGSGSGGDGCRQKGQCYGYDARHVDSIRGLDMLRCVRRCVNGVGMRCC